MLTLALVVFREQLGEGVASFSNVIGAGGVGVLVGIATAGLLEDRLSKDRIVARRVPGRRGRVSRRRDVRRSRAP